ncbi:MAG: phosphomannomutase/phosphoglucomutase [Holophagales bacterium]|nr:phosphomannomutase/phosphoglucomutase [Holophagales bacterium]MYG32298.1 phosphomannomutase/phosphoglucomutase [Holophagales bacterium]MYI78533.1 phosphomannomutase/phosphoglucomutase [Holophagales bacterium]
MAGIFKAYDVRGLYPGQLNEELARRIGMAFERLITLEGDQGAALPRTVVVSRDMRDHSVPLSAALCAGLTSAGLDVLDIGLATTPMNYFATGHLSTAGGIQVTASHNAAEYNGLKFSLAGAVPVSGDHGIPIIERHALGEEPAPAASPGRVEARSVEAEYAEHVLSFLDRSFEAGDAPKLRLAADAANGMGTIYRPLLEACGVQLLPLYFELDGSFPNHEANPLLPANLRDLSALVIEQEADLGVSFDGDGDRAAFVDERGEPIGSDLITALIAGQMLQRESGGAVIHDIRSSRAVPEYIREHGGTPLPERVGHSFVKATMRRTGAIFGGELAGHYYFRQNYCADSSILAVVAVLNLIRRSGPSGSEISAFSEITAPLRRYAKSSEINFEVEDKDGTMEALVQRYATEGGGALDRLDGIRIDFDDWWFNVRPSNTEPLLRLVLEASTPEELAARQAELTAQLGDPI